MTNLPLIPTRAQYIMVGVTISIEGVLADFLKPILPKISVEPTSEGLIKIHQLINGNTESKSSKLRGGGHRIFTLTMINEDYAV